jgi:ribosome biogenesis protein SSF1/2
VGNAVRSLMHQWRSVFLPWSSKSLHGKNKSLKDFLVIAASLSVSHMQLFTSPSAGTSLRMMRFSNGPTLSFRVESFTLRDEIMAQHKRPPAIESDAYEFAPIVVLNNFSLPGNPPQVALLEATFRSLFPTVNVQLAQTSQIRRVVLFQYVPEQGLVEVRHFYIGAKAVGLSKTVKKLLEGRLPTKLGTLENLDDVLDREGAWSDTDGEGEEVPLVRPMRAHKERCRVKLFEIGPRMCLRLVKVENGFAGGEVLFHDHVRKSAREVAEDAAKVRVRRNEKAKRKAVQDENVRTKRQREEEKRQSKQNRRMEATQRRNQRMGSDGHDDGHDDDDGQGERYGGFVEDPVGSRGVANFDDDDE